MHRSVTFALHRGSGQIAVQPIGIEGREGSHQQSHRLQAFVQGLISGKFIGAHLAGPETAAVQTHIPVRQVVVDKRIDGAGSLGGLIVVQIGGHLGNKGVEQRQDPAVDFRTLCHRLGGFGAREAVDVGIEGEELVGVVKRAEQFAAHLGHTGLVIFQVVPGSGVGNHVPAHGVDSEAFDIVERIDGVAKTLRHLVAVLVEHQTVRDHGLERHAVEHHAGNGMQCEEPSAGLVNALGDEIGRIDLAVVQNLLVFEGIMNLCIGHRTGIEPYVDQVELTVHRLPGGGHEDNAVHVGAVYVDLGVILLAHVAGHETGGGVGVLLHQAGFHRLVDLLTELFVASDNYFLGAVVGTPDGERRAPVAGTRQVPVLDVFKPFAEAAASGRSGFPLYGAVQLYEPFAGLRCADKPAVERIIEHGLVRTPAVRIIVHMFLGAESLAFLLQFHAKLHIEVVGLSRGLLVVFTVGAEARIIGILDICAGMAAVQGNVDTFLHKRIGQFVQGVETTPEVDHRAGLAAQVYQEERRDAGSLGNLGVVGTEGRSDMDDSRTVVGRYIIARDHAEGFVGQLYKPIAVDVEHLVGMRGGIGADIFGRMLVDFLAGLHPGHELSIFHAHEVGTFPAACDAVRHHLVARLPGLHVGLGAILLEIGIDEHLGHHYGDFVAGVGVVGAHGHIVELRADAEGRVRGQCPGGGGPCHEAGTSPALHLRFGLGDVEQHRGRQVLDVAVAARLVQLVRAQAGAGRRTVRLNCISFVQKSLVVELLEQPPQRLHVLAVVSDIGVLEVNPITHAVSQVGPFPGVFHHLAAAGGVVIVYGYLHADILLGDTQSLLDAQLHGESVRVPAGLALHMEALHGLVAAHDVLDGAGHDMMYARLAVGRGGSLVENERRITFTFLHAALEQIVSVPVGQHFLVDVRQIELAVVFLEFHVVLPYYALSCKITKNRPHMQTRMRATDVRSMELTAKTAC